MSVFLTQLRVTGTFHVDNLYVNVTFFPSRLIFNCRQLQQMDKIGYIKTEKQYSTKPHIKYLTARHCRRKFVTCFKIFESDCVILAHLVERAPRVRKGSVAATVVQSLSLSLSLSCHPSVSWRLQWGEMELGPKEQLQKSSEPRISLSVYLIDHFPIHSTTVDSIARRTHILNQSYSFCHIRA